MKTRFLALLLSVILIVTAAAPLTASAVYTLDEGVEISATTAYVVFLGPDMDTDAVIYEKNPDQRIAPAGLVRIMVGLYTLKTLEEQQIDPAIATATYTEAIADLTWDTLNGTGLPDVDLEEGNVLYIQDLLNISLVNSAGDALTLLMSAVSGSSDAFVSGMNELAAAIGCTNTHFQNAYGLDDPEQYSSARDMYRILRYASLNYPAIMTILGQSEYTVSPVVGEAQTWPSTNELLRRWSDYYNSDVRYGRSGTTESTGPSCASVARVGGLDILTVVMGCTAPTEDNSAAFTDSTTLYNWVENEFSYKTVLRGTQPITRAKVDLAWSTDSVALVAAHDVVVLLRKDTNAETLRQEITLDPAYLNENGALTAPIDKETVYGTAKVYDGDVLIAEIPLLAADYVGRSQLLAVGDSLWKIFTSPFVLIALAVLLILFVAYVIMSVVHNNSRRRKNQKKVKRYR